MLIQLRETADPSVVKSALSELGLWTEVLRGPTGSTRAFSVLPHSRAIEASRLREIDGVDEVLISSTSHPLVDASVGKTVDFAETRLGVDTPPVLMAGPCSVESPEQIMACARLAAASGATFLRGGAFKPRTSPYSFCGHGRPALHWLREAADRHWLSVVTEVMSADEVDAVAEVADLIQIGSRNMQNYSLLRAVGACDKPVMLKRGMAATVEEWLNSGEHLMAAGAPSIVFCERGIQGFDSTTRNLLDLGTVALFSHVLGLPIVVDPSHAAGRRDLIPHLSKAALAAGAHGLLVEVHPEPGLAQSDGAQALDAESLRQIGLECV